MALARGARFGPYEIADSIGAGGMGEVYRAVDTDLKRDVAIKVLPPAFVSDGDRLARFQREAEVLATLNHPNIAHVYGLQRADGVQALGNAGDDCVAATRLAVPALAFLMLRDTGTGEIFGRATANVFAWSNIAVIISALLRRRLEEIGLGVELDPLLICRRYIYARRSSPAVWWAVC